MTHYQVLGVSETASPEEIKSARLKKVKEFHPDTHQGDPTLEEQMKQVNQAYDILSDPKLRQNYDAQLSQERAAQTKRAAPKPVESQRTAPGAQAWKTWQAQAAPARPHQPPTAAPGEFVRQKQPVAATMVSQSAQTPSTSDSGWGILFKILATAGVSYAVFKTIENAGTHWDPTVQRRRGPDGRFRSS
jgi:curved DNA-binding protein CbpA